MKDLALRAPVQLAIAENATSPTATLGTIIWSTTANKRLVWDSAKWAAASGSAGGSGDVVGPGSSVAGNVAVFADASGKVLADGGRPPVLPVQAMLTATVANSSSTTPTTLTGHTWTIPAGKALCLDSLLVCTAAATTTGIGHGGQIVIPGGVTGTLRCAWLAYTNLASTAAATGLSDGDVLVLTTAGTTEFLNLGTATTSGNNSSELRVILNNGTNVDVTFSVRFRSEVNASAITAQPGTAAHGFIFTP